jgi:hypothetical protein
MRSPPHNEQKAHNEQGTAASHLVRPPEGVHLGDLELLELLAHAPSAVIGQGVAILRAQIPLTFERVE